MTTTAIRRLIGIPTLNGPERLHRCLKSVIDCGVPADTQILVADDGSFPAELEANKNVTHAFAVEMLMSGGARNGIAATWNRLVRHVADAQTIILVNDDVEVVSDWSDVLVYSVEENLEVGAVGLPCLTGVLKPAAPEPRVDYVEAKLLDGGGTLLSAGGACFAFRRESWEAVGGFDERYFVFYEEVDFSVALRQHGRFPYFASYPVVYHLGGATNADTRNLSAAKHLALSRQSFAEKWGARPGELRRKLAERPRPSRLNEWNSQLKFLEE